MAKARFEDLVQQYPQLWEKAQKKFSSPQAQKKYFRSLVEARKAREIEKQIRAREKSKERRRRTRALILFALQILEKVKEKEVFQGFCVRDHNGKLVCYRFDQVLPMLNLKAKEGRQEVDYAPYLRRVFEKEI